MQPLKLHSSSAALKSLDNTVTHCSNTGSLKRSLPNLLTFFRLFLVPISVLLILEDKLFYAFICFSVAAVTDSVDGYLARLWGVESKFGQLMDPLADKSLIVLSCLTLGYTGHLPLWFIALISLRDISLVIGGLIISLKKYPVSLEPSTISKLNTFAQIILIGSCLVLNFHFFSQAPLWQQIYMHLILIIVVITTLISGILYYRNAIKSIRSKK